MPDRPAPDPRAPDARGPVDVHRAADRFRTRTDRIDSRHGFSFGSHYDPADTHFGLLLAHNEDLVAAGGGYDMHPHRDLEILTWVLDGELGHADSTGHRGTVRPGVAQRMTAGSGIRHAERNAGDGELHFVQMWVLPDESGLEPGYAQLDVGAELDHGGLVVVASGLARHAGQGAVPIRQRDAAMHVARLQPAAGVRLPSAPLVHVFVARGSVEIEGVGALRCGDTARVTGSDGRRLTAGPDGTEVLVWEMHASLSESMLP